MLTNATVKHLEGQSHEKFDFELKKKCGGIMDGHIFI